MNGCVVGAHGGVLAWMKGSRSKYLPTNWPSPLDGKTSFRDSSPPLPTHFLPLGRTVNYRRMGRVVDRFSPSIPIDIPKPDSSQPTRSQESNPAQPKFGSILKRPSLIFTVFRSTGPVSAFPKCGRRQPSCQHTHRARLTPGRSSRDTAIPIHQNTRYTESATKNGRRHDTYFKR